MAYGRSPGQSAGVHQRFGYGVKSVDVRHARHWQRFWASYIRLSFLVLLLESVVISVYFVLIPVVPHRTALIAISSTSGTVALGAALFVNHLANRSWRACFSLLATLLAGIALTVTVSLDGGLDSRFVCFMALPLISAALALPPRALVICGTATAVELGAVAVLDQNVLRSADDLSILSAFLFGVFVLTMGAAKSRSRLQGDEDGLLFEVERLALTDSLTGCFNHGAFYDRLEGEINRALRSGEPLSLLIVDIDLFKSFNDSRGHAAGDAALATIGSTMQGHSRNFDAVARIGGDEFAVILPTTGSDTAGDIARRMVKTLTNPGGLELTVSIGYATLDPREPTARRLFRDADLGLYRAKAEGRGGAARREDEHCSSLELPGTDNHRSAIRNDADRERWEESLREANQETIEATSILDALQSTTSVGLGFVDCEFRILRVNSMLAAVNGGTVEDQLGRKVSEVVPDLWPDLEPLYQAVLDGIPVINKEVSGETAADPHRLHHWLVNLYPVCVRGDVHGIGVVVVDISDRKQVEEGQAALTRALVGALAGSVEMRDPYTAGHQERVAHIAVEVATEIGLSDAEIEDIELAARIHDLGKMAVPAEILARPGRLRPAEIQVVREHSRTGAQLLERVGFSVQIRDIVLQHHERIDGTGYPGGLVGDQISLGARIIAVADVFEAMVSHRPYRAALGWHTALAELERGSGITYDPEVCGACITLVHQGRIRFDEANEQPAEDRRPSP